MNTESKKAVLAALAANSGLAIAKFVGFAATGAASLLAEAVHSVADTSNQALLLWGGRAAQREPSPKHPYGYGRERYFWSFIVALVIFILGGGFAIMEGLNKLREPHAISGVGWAIGILVVGIVLEAASLRAAVRASQPFRGTRSWWQFIRTTRRAELAVILLEDLGAVAGLVLALVGIGLAELTGDPRFDSLGSIAIGVLLCAIAAILAVELKSLLIGESASPDQERVLRNALLDDPAVVRVLHLRTQHMGPDQLLIGAKLEFAAGLAVEDLAVAINRTEERVRSEIPETRIIYIEPDLSRNAPSE